MPEPRPPDGRPTCVKSLVAGAALACLIVTAGPAGASCVLPPPLGEVIASAPVVFVGTVVGFDGDERHAVVQPEEIWAGPDLDRVVVVRGAADDQPGVFTSVDRTFLLRRRYLFVPANTAPPFEDNACTATQVMTSEIESLRPADARPVSTAESEPAPDGAFPLAPALGAAAAAVIATAAWLSTRRRNAGSAVDGFRRRPPHSGE